MLREFRRDWAKYKQAKEEFDKEAKKSRTVARASQKQGSKLKLLDPADEVPEALKRLDLPEKPVLLRIVSSDTTVEALCVILSENRRGLLLKRDELIAFVRGMDMYRKGKGTDRQFYMSAYSGESFTLDRKSNLDGIPIIVPWPYLCVVGCLTPDMLVEFEDEQGREDGFVDRFLWTFPDVAKVVYWTEESVSEESKRAWEGCLQKLWELKDREERPGQFAPNVVGLLPGAQKAWIEFYNAISSETGADDFPQKLIGPWRKLRDYGARLALVMHLLRVACGECVNAEMVEEVSVQAAVQLIDYFKSQTVRVHAAMSRKTELPEADRALVEAVAKLVVANGDRWAGNAKMLLEQLVPHAGEAVDLPRWPTSPEAMGHAIRRVAGHLAKDRRIKVNPPAPTDKTRTICIIRQPPKPPKPPSGGATSATQTTCDTGGSGQSQNPTAQTAQEEAENRAVRAVDPERNGKPPKAQPSERTGVADDEGGSGGLGGGVEQSDDIEDEAL